MTVFLAIASVTRALRAIAGEDAGFEARQLVAHMLKCAPGGLAAVREQVLDDTQSAVLDGLIARRLKREPLQYILGEWSFMGLRIFTRPCALIPRPETETLATHALALAHENGYRTALDLCCGTGCIGISLARLAALEVTATDISPACAALTEENARENGVALRVLQGNWFEPVNGRFDMIVSNPPYIVSRELDTLQPEVGYEPRLALDGGEDGLKAYRVIERAYTQYLRPGGALLMEVGAGQAQSISALFGQDVEWVMDISSIQRVACKRPAIRD